VQSVFNTKGIAIVQRLIVIATAFLVSACGTTFNSRGQVYDGPNQVTAVYVYSFLDLREGALGRQFLAEVRRQLSDALSKEGIRTKQLWFNESPLRAQFSLEDKGPNQANTSTRVPVDEVVIATREDEQFFGATHRLIVFPASVMMSNTGSNFDIRWTLIDSKSNKVSWSTASFSSHAKWFLGDENPTGRATEFVNGLVGELRKAHVISNRGT
jgi:hypothetical protein